MFYPAITYSGFNTSAAISAASAENAAQEARTQVDLFKHDIDRLLLITQALWTLMKQQHGYNDDTLVQLIQDIDKRRATPDGTVPKDPPVTCPSCGKINSCKRNFCMYCGEPLPMNPFAH
jgi:hypothetical protein